MDRAVGEQLQYRGSGKGGVAAGEVESGDGQRPAEDDTLGAAGRVKTACHRCLGGSVTRPLPVLDALVLRCGGRDVTKHGGWWLGCGPRGGYVGSML